MSYLDVESVLFDASGAEDVLAEVNNARKVGQAIAEGDAADKSQDALAMLNSDVSEIRQSLAFELRLTSSLPESLAVSIATSPDPDVAGPFLETSPLVTEAFILNIVDQLDSRSQSAIAKRPDVTDTVAKVLIDKGDEKALLSLVRNDKADIHAQTFEAIAQKYSDKPKLCLAVEQAAKQRSGAEPLQANVEERRLPFNVLVSRARAFSKNGMLTAAYVEECLLAGKISEVEAGLCVLSDMQRKDVRTSLLQSSETLRALEQKCGLAPGTLVTNAAVIRSAYKAQ